MIRFHPFQSLPEALIYSVMMLLLIFNISGDIALITIVERHSQTLKTVNADTQLIEKQQLCIASFFLQNNRTAITLNNLQACQPVIHEVTKS